MGTKGTAGLTLGLICVAGGCDLEGTSGGAAEDGVVGRVESASEGACEVTGVSSSDVAGTGGLQSFWSTTVSSGTTSLSPLCGGNSTGSISDCGVLRFLRRFRALGGIGSSGTEYHGSFAGQYSQEESGRENSNHSLEDRMAFVCSALELNVGVMKPWRSLRPE